MILILLFTIYFNRCKPILMDKPLDMGDQFLLHQLTQYVTFLIYSMLLFPNPKIHGFEMVKGKNQ